MIAKATSSKSFASLADYLITSRDGDPRRVAWTATRNLGTTDPLTAAAIMEATALQNVRTTEPVYHLTLSFHPTDVVDRATMEAAADRMLAELGLTSHQVLMVAHGDRPHPHVHLAINRVHPETFRAWDRWHDYGTIDRTLRTLELKYGLVRLNHQPRTPDAPMPKPTRGSTSLNDVEHLAHGFVEAQKRYDRIAALSQTVEAARNRAEQWASANSRGQMAVARFNEALGQLYKDPVAASQKIIARAAKLDPESAFLELRYHASTYGELRPIPRAQLNGARTIDDAVARTTAATAAARGTDAYRAVSVVHDLARANGLSDIRVADVAGVLHNRAVKAAERADSHRGSRDAAAAAVSQHRTALQRALRRMTPRDLARLRNTLTPATWAVVRPILHRVRNALLGREEHAR